MHKRQPGRDAVCVQKKAFVCACSALRVNRSQDQDPESRISGNAGRRQDKPRIHERIRNQIPGGCAAHALHPVSFPACGSAGTIMRSRKFRTVNIPAVRGQGFRPWISPYLFVLGVKWIAFVPAVPRVPQSARDHPAIPRCAALHSTWPCVPSARMNPLSVDRRSSPWTGARS